MKKLDFDQNFITWMASIFFSSSYDLMYFSDFFLQLATEEKIKIMAKLISSRIILKLLKVSLLEKLQYKN